MSIVRRSDVYDPFSQSFFDPFEGFPFHFDFVGSVADTRARVANDAVALANARINWKETREAYVFEVHLPGVKEEGVKVEVEVEVEEVKILQISGDRAKERDEKNDKCHRVELSGGKFMLRFRLPDDARVDQVKAGMENGILIMRILKEEVKKPEVKSIEISG